MRLPVAALLGPGYLPNLLTQAPNLNAFRVRQNTGADMNVLVGSGTTKVDGYVLLGTVAGQGAYIIRLDATTKAVSVPATDATNPARYGVYAYIDDTAYSGTASRAYANVSCIRGTPAGSPTTPGPLAAWSAYALLWEFQLPANATAVTNTILDAGTDQRRPSRVAAGAGGVRAEATKTSTQLSIPSSATDISGLTVTFLNPGNRRYRLMAHVQFSDPSAGGAVTLQMQTGASGAGTVIGGWADTMAAAESATASILTMQTPAAGSVSYHLRAFAASGTVDQVASATSPNFLIVEDVGPA